MNKKYIVRLSAEERAALEALVKKGKTQAYRIKHANILLAVDVGGPGWTDEKTSVAFKCNRNTAHSVRQRFVVQGIEAAVERKKQEKPSRQRIIDGEKEARLLAIACSRPPKGRAKWTLSMLADELVALEIVETVSRDTVGRALKKTSSSPTCASAG